MVSIVPPHDSGAFGNGRQTGRSDGQQPGERRQPSESEKTQPLAAAGAAVTIRLSDAARVPLSDADSVRGISRSDRTREALPGFAADLDRKTGGLASSEKALEKSREALSDALASGDAGKVAAAALKLADAKGDAEEEKDGFPFRASRVVEESTVVYDPESGRYLPSRRRVALSIETDSGKSAPDLRNLDAGKKGVSVIHREPAVPVAKPPSAEGSGVPEGVARVDPLAPARDKAEH